MALERKDRVKDATITTGTGTVNLSASAPTGFRTFVSTVTSGATVRYLIESEDQTEWEVGEGVFTDGTPDTLTRVTVFASSNSGNLVNFSAGTKNVSLVFTSKDTDDIAPKNLLKNGNFINNSTNGYGGTPDDWTNSSANPVQGGIPTLTKQQVIDLLGVADGDIEGLWPLNEASGNALDLSSNGYNLTDTNTVDASDDGLMAKARDFELSNNEYFTIADASCPNLEISGSQTWIAFVKPESFTVSTNRTVLSKRNTTIKQLYINGDAIPKAQIYLQGLTTNQTLASDVGLQTGKWYMLVGVYDSANSLLKIWVNGIKKEVTASGSASDSNGNFQISAYNGTNEPYDGLVQNAMVLSVALSDNQVKKLFAETMYKGQKIRRATTNAYLYQQLPQDLVERLRGKTVALRAEMYQAVASTGQISIHQTMADGTTDETIISATDATTGSWLTKSCTGTLEADVVTVEIRLNHSTSDGNTWFKKVSLYEGSTSLPYDHSKNDWARFPNLLQMKFPHIYSAYQYEQFRLFTSPFTMTMRASGSMTTTSVSQSVSKYIYNGESIQWFQTMTWTNGGTAHVANYVTMPFSAEASIVAVNNGHPVQVVNNAVQEVGVARYISKNELEVYRYTGGNWTLAANQTFHENSIFPIDIN